METTTTVTRRLRFSRYGLAEDPRGGHCVMTYQGRELLGEVKDVIIADRPGGSRGIDLDVRFMNGEPWPIQPMAAAVQMLVREYV